MKYKNIKKHILSGLDPDSPALKQTLLIFLTVSCVIFTFAANGTAEEIIREVDNMHNVNVSEFENKIVGMVAGYPMKNMASGIAKQNKKVASYIVAIAKKESNWGKYSPKKDGRDCYNYWGYRGTYNQTDSGYSCFDSPEQAVGEVGQRIGELVDQKIDTPRKMAVWKCGWSCAGQDPEAVNKWISDVDFYFKKTYN